MPYTPDPTDYTQPLDTVDASTAAAEFRALKGFLQGQSAGNIIIDGQLTGNQFNGDLHRAGGNTGSVVSGVASTIVDAVGLSGLVIVTATVISLGAIYTASAQVTGDGAGGVRILANNGANLTITLVGTVIKTTQTSGVNRIISWSYIQIPI